MEKKITVGLFIDTYYPMIDGVISVVDNYAKNLIKYANVIVFAPNVAGKNYDDSKLPYKVVRCKSISAPIIDYSCPTPHFDKNFLETLNNSNLDIVHIHSPFFLGKLGIQYAKKHNIPVIATMHSQFKQDFQRAVHFNFLANVLTKSVIKVFDACDECWAVNSEVARIFYEKYHCKVLPKVMNNASEMLPIKDSKSAINFINTMHNIAPSEYVFLFVGRINKLKNIFFIVESLKIFKNKYSNIKFKMLFVGSGQDESELKSLISNNNMENDIILCGKVSDRELLAKYYKRADLFLFPSMYDASSIVQIEAASQKTPSLFLENSATSATVTNNVNGFISRNNPKDYADKIFEIITDNKLYLKVSKNAYNNLYINWQDKIKEVYNKYLELINRNN